MSQVVEQVSDQVRADVLARFDHKPPTNTRVIDAHVNARQKCKNLADWAMDILPPGQDLNAALDRIFAACVALNTAIAQTQLVGDVQRTLDKLKAEQRESESAEVKAGYFPDELAP